MVIGVFSLGLRVWGSYGYRGLGFREVMVKGVFSLGLRAWGSYGYRGLGFGV